MKVKIIKKTDYETSEGVKGTHYTVAYKGRAFGLFPTNFKEAEITVTDSEIEITVKPQILLEQVTNQETGEIRKLGRLVPEMDLQVAEA